jgi:L-alanine-DL-glutamate epimerase-like enolase superfamily enzyme
MLKIAALTQAFNVSFAPHAMENIQLPLAAALPNVPFLERLLMFEPVTALVFRDAPVPVDGFMHVTDRPGLGLDLNMDFVREADARAG